MAGLGPAGPGPVSAVSATASMGSLLAQDRLPDGHGQCGAQRAPKMHLKGSSETPCGNRGEKVKNNEILSRRPSIAGWESQEDGGRSGRRRARSSASPSQREDGASWEQRHPPGVLPAQAPWPVALTGQRTRTAWDTRLQKHAQPGPIEGSPGICSLERGRDTSLRGQGTGASHCIDGLGGGHSVPRKPHSPTVSILGEETASLGARS